MRSRQHLPFRTVATCALSALALSACGGGPVDASTTVGPTADVPGSVGPGAPGPAAATLPPGSDTTVDSSPGGVIPGTEPETVTETVIEPPAPALPLYQGAAGTWCGPVDDQTVWVSAALTAPSCETGASLIYTDAADGSASMPDGIAFQVSAAAATSLGTFTTELRRCDGGVCETLQGSVTLDSYTPNTGATGTWSATTSSGERLEGQISADWCAWDEQLPSHPLGDRLARNISLSEIAVYQAVKIPIMVDGSEVVERNAGVVQNREALVRVFVEPQAGFEARELSVRLTLVTGDAEPMVLDAEPQMVVDASNDPELASTFNFQLPPEALGADTTYQAEIRETAPCATLEGTALGARFPETAPANLGAIATGPVFVTLVPVQYDTDGSGRLPDTSAEQLESFRSEMMAQYPATEVILTVREPIATTESNLGSILNQVNALRQDDAPASNVHYYGLISPADTFRDYCNGSCVTGIAGLSGGGRNGPTGGAGVGIGFLASQSTTTFIHEIGHTHGQSHAPCGGADGPEAEYPYPAGNIGVWGFDLRSLADGSPESLQDALLDPEGHNDFMGYCDNNWISDYNYEAFRTRITALSEALGTQALRVGTPLVPVAWPTLMVDASGSAQWGLPLSYREAPRGVPEMAEVLDANMLPLGQIEVFRTTISDIGGAHLSVPQPEAGWAAIRVAGSEVLSFSEPVSVAPYGRVLR